MKIKICGITNLEDAHLCADLGADALGFIFYKNSKRYIEPRAAKSVISKLPPFISKVGVFVKEDINFVNKIAKDLKLSSIQLHGDESMDYIKTIDYPVIKSFRINDSFSFDQLKIFKNCSFLLDTFHPNEYGGTGLEFNWEKIPKKIRNKIIIAGGVSIENIEFLSTNIKPYAIDISSSLEVEPGKKDHKKVKAFFEKYNDLRNTKC